MMKLKPKGGFLGKVLMRLYLFLTMFGLVMGTASFSFAEFRGIYRGDGVQVGSVMDVAREIGHGSVVVIGENHGLPRHRDQHMELLRALRAAGHKVSVGFEFFPYTGQHAVDLWRWGQLPEENFLQEISWNAYPFELYRSQALFPLLGEGGRTLALNSPREVTAEMARGGIESLSPELRSLLPKDFTLGRDSYRRRFEAMMPHLPDGPKKDFYFQAQSAWDDTMAWRAAEFVVKAPEQTLVIIVGDFHVQYGGGLPDRLRARLQRPVLTVSQVNSWGLTQEELEQEIQPSPQEGVRADWIWIDESRVPSAMP